MIDKTSPRPRGPDPLPPIVPRLSDSLALPADDLRDVAAAASLAELSRLLTSRTRDMLRADGATLVLREGTMCHYLDEDAIEPLWKGRRFPGRACISGWVMRHGTHVVIEDIRGDVRIPQDLYRQTFVRSLAMVPIAGPDPIGACGAYWSSRHAASDAEIRLLEEIATAVAEPLARLLPSDG